MGILPVAAKCIAALILTASTASVANSQSAAANYPTRTIKLVVPFTPGASTDVVARLFGQKLSEAWGQQLVVDNRPGAGGGIGADAVVKSDPDGYTLMVTNQGPSILNSLLRAKPPYAVDDMIPIVRFGYSPLIVIANPKFPASNVKEMIAYAKANPGKTMVGSSGTNSNLHIALEMLKAATGANLVHVPYKGTGPSLNDVVAGNINAAYTTTVSADGLIKAGNVKVLGVAGPRRMDVIASVPTFAEQGIKNADASLWIGLVAPAKTPRAIVDKINADVNKILNDPDVRQRFSQWGLEIAGGTPEDFSAVIKSEVDHVKELIASKALEVQ